MVQQCDTRLGVAVVLAQQQLERRRGRTEPPGRVEHRGERKGHVARHSGVELSAMGLAQLQSFHPDIGNDVYQVLGLLGSLNARSTLGGTAPPQVQQQIERHLTRLEAAKARDF